MAAVVAGWVESADEAERWAAMSQHPVDPAVFARWHAEEGVRAFVLVQDGRPVAYGEVWEDRDEDEAELARLLVEPGERGRGLGAVLAGRLAVEARAAGFEHVWVRVVPGNMPALHAYRRAGFVQTTPEEEAAFNVGQPRDYVWMRLDR